MNSYRPVDLKLDWATGTAARVACERWHYTGKMPNSGVKIGVWEDGHFAGVILFGVGAGAATNGEKYGLRRAHDVAELQRVALKPGHKTPVSRCVAIAIRMLRRQSPNLRLLISFADTGQGHHGGIYQAGNWIYAGLTESDRAYVVHGRPRHAKTIHSRGWKQTEEWLRAHVDPNATIETQPPKHRYLLPLDDEMRKVIAPLAKPYPKRAKEPAAGNPSARGRCNSDPLAPDHNGARHGPERAAADANAH